MSEPVDHPTLLEAVAAFLLADVAPKMESDKAAQFRVLIAANVTTVVAAELRTASEREGHQARRLRAHFGSSDSESLANLQSKLMNAIRDPNLSETETMRLIGLLKAEAADTLAVTNPRFTLD